MNIKIFTDGASSGNPGPGGWGAVILIFKNESSKNIGNSKVIELGGREERTTNNRMELKAAIEALRFLHIHSLVKKPYDMILYSDSTYVVKGITSWVHGWIQKGWMNSKKEPVQNKDLWEELVQVEEYFDVSWRILPGHSGIAGNERADSIATSFAMNASRPLFSGSLEEYDMSIDDIDEGALSQKITPSKKNRTNAKAHSYLSLVDGVLEKHATWKECEKRVKGKRGVRFKKSLSPEEELDILESWGFRKAHERQ